MKKRMIPQEIKHALNGDSTRVVHVTIDLLAIGAIGWNTAFRCRIESAVLCVKEQQLRLRRALSMEHIYKRLCGSARCKIALPYDHEHRNNQ